MTPLAIAAYKGYEPIVRMMVEEQFAAKSGLERNALHTESSVNVNNARSTDKATPLSIAVMQGHGDVVGTLLLAGADTEYAK